VRLHRRALLALAPAAALAVGLLTPTSAHAASVGGLGVRPAHSDPSDPATKAYFKPVVAPGGTFSDAVTVSNSSDKPMTLLVNAVDGVTSTASGAVYANRQDAVLEAGRWLAMTGASIVVGAHSTVDVPFTVHVPSDAAAGDHLAGIAVEDAHPQSSGGTFSVTEVIRAVVGVQIQVPGPAVFSMAAGTPSLAKLEGTSNAAVTVPLTNTGGLLGKPTVTVDLDGNDYHRSVTRQLDTILPGDKIPYPFIWPDDLAPGNYRIRVRVETGKATVSSAGESAIGATLAGAANPGAGKQVTITPRAKTSTFGPVLLAIVLTLLLVAAAMRVRRIWTLRSAG
jgi:hypothetical protein